MNANLYGNIRPSVDVLDYRDPAVEVDDAYTWDMLPPTGPNGLVRVVFSSQGNRATRNADPWKIDRLIELDEVAWGDATNQPGFLYYSPGEIDEATLLARSFCLWETADDAKTAARRPQHREAVSFAMVGPGKDVYSRYSVQKDHLVSTPSGLVVTRLGRMTVVAGQIVESEGIQ